MGSEIDMVNVIKNMPPLIRRILSSSDSWIVGGGCLSENPKDIDIWVPVETWSIAVSILPQDTEVKLNSFGGYKFEIDGVVVDLWTCTANTVFGSHMFKSAYHFNSNTMLMSK